jgi:hypothetical protein
MKKTQPKIEPPQFDEEGYQINMTSLNGEPLPDLSGESYRFDKSSPEWKVVPIRKGGARAGAGRKPAGNVPLVVRLSPEIIAKVKARSKQEGVTISEVVARRLAGV